MRAASGVSETGSGGGNFEMISAALCSSVSLSPLVISFIGSLTRSRSRNMSLLPRAAEVTPNPIHRLILDGTVVDVRLDRKATAISLLVVIGVRTDGQKVLLAVKSMGGESSEAILQHCKSPFSRPQRCPAR